MSGINPVCQHLALTICNDADEASDMGLDHRANGTKPIQVEKVVVVRKGTQEGNSTVDFVLKDEAGNVYAFMITGNLLKSIPC